MRERFGSGPRGFSIAELLMVVAAIAIMAVIALPFMLSFVQASQTRGAAQELKSLLNHARQLAITQNASYRVDADTTNNWLRFCSGTAACTDATAWKGPGTNSNGWMRLANDARIVFASASPVFTSLGAASTASTLRVRNSQGSSCLDVVVSASGRVQTSTSPTCP